MTGQLIPHGTDVVTGRKIWNDGQQWLIEPEPGQMTLDQTDRLSPAIRPIVLLQCLFAPQGLTPAGPMCRVVVTQHRRDFLREWLFSMRCDLYRQLQNTLAKCGYLSGCDAADMIQGASCVKNFLKHWSAEEPLAVFYVERAGSEAWYNLMDDISI